MNRLPVVPTVLLTTAVLTVGLASGATAAKLITGKDIKDGTVAVRDLAPLARTTFKWAHDDSTGVAVPSCTDTTLEDCNPLLAVGIVPGAQLVTLTGAIDNANGVVPSISNRCALVHGGEVLTEYRFALAANGQPGEVDSFSLQQVVTVPDASQPVQVRCTEMGGEALQLVEPRLTSVKLDKVS